MKKLLSAALAICLVLSLSVPASAAQNSLDNFQKTAEYTGGFTDVPESYWAAPSVKTCFEYGLMKGATATTFNPDGVLSVAEALVMADRVHEVFTTGGSTLTNGSPWYQPYVDYAVAQGIIAGGDFTDYTAKVTRAEMAYIFYNALPASALPAINNVLALPDVDETTPHAAEIFALYEAGILSGSDIYGTCKPDATITRAESAAIIARVAIAGSRKSVTLLEDWEWSDNVVLALPQDAQAGEDGMGVFFNAGMAILSSVQDDAYRGISVTALPSETLNSLLTEIYKNSGLTFSDSASTAVNFGAIAAYRTTGTLTADNGISLKCVSYFYITGDSMEMIALLSDDDALLTAMVNSVRISSSSVSVKL
ncbi:S-layer homology domain-containing protein [Lawsonibacter faecis]|uniref:S-layer homology domain-containing protein n=1 Tax=Lawsonibacter faecis TaxID=2763052 RepID=A0A8J6JMA1_9FIRM|nr:MULTISPECIES: S-layer homology domain-containing protein [Oscillospiraceae]MBC5738623.1 S-layer homology domain-containing protein [Lawsonibacter faecis]